MKNDRIPPNPHPVKPPPNLPPPMSDINPNRMIPLHIADQAVAACEKEIAALKAEVERLRKAGDAMADALSPFRVKPFPGPYLCDLQKGWEAAKEGKPSV